MNEPIKLSRMPCYAGFWKAQATAHTADIHDKPGVYVQFIEGCGYSVFEMEPEEALELAIQITIAVNKTKEEKFPTQP